MTYDTGQRQYNLVKMHARRHRKSTKVGNNTYAFHERIDATNMWQVTIKYHDTAIITCLYQVSEPRWNGTIGVPYDPKYIMSENISPVMLEVETDGWNTPSTIRRLNQFMRNNKINVTFYRRQGFFCYREESYVTGTTISEGLLTMNRLALLLDDTNSKTLVRGYMQENHPGTPFELRNPLGEKHHEAPISRIQPASPNR